MHQYSESRNEWTSFLVENNQVTKTLWKNRVQGKYYKCMQREFDICKTLSQKRHSNIVNYLEVYEDSEKFVIVMERLNCNLRDYWHDNISTFNQEELDEMVINIIVQIVNGYKHLREVFGVWFLHRDLLADNIFCYMEDRVFKIGDFGISKISDEFMEDHTREINQQIAPEAICYHDHTPKMDIYTLGVICYHIAIHPSEFDSPIDKNRSGLANPLHKLIMSMLQPSTSRITWEELFIQIINFQQKQNKIIDSSQLRNNLSNLSTDTDTFQGLEFQIIQSYIQQFDIIRNISLFKIEELGVIYKICSDYILEQRISPQYSVVRNLQLDQIALFEQNNLKIDQITDKIIKQTLEHILQKIEKLPQKQSTKFPLIIELLKKKRTTKRTCHIQ